MITSAFRDPKKQMQLVNENCTPESIAVGKCAHKPGKSIACVPNATGTNCPHTTGAAVDVWAACQDKNTPGTWVNCVSPDDISTCTNPANVKICQENKYQKILIKQMDPYFCLWAKEAWHFEIDPGYSQPCYSP
jgi:D-alanyl-D-alanine dipeptidase